MKETKQTKEYVAPKFQLVGQYESNNVFFATSGTVQVGGAIGSMGSVNGGW